MKKEIYSAPELELLELALEAGFAASSDVEPGHDGNPFGF